MPSGVQRAPVTRVFGGVAMTFFGLNYMLVASLLAGIVMLIPLVGPFLALIPPILFALFQVPVVALWLLTALFIYQFVIVNVLMPRLLSDAVGLHPLLVFAAILVSIKIAGFWGAFSSLWFSFSSCRDVPHTAISVPVPSSRSSPRL